MNEIAAHMAVLNSGSFTTSTPFHQQHDSGFYENTPHSRNLFLNSPVEKLETNYFPLRKNLFGKKRNSENIPDPQFSQKPKLLFSRSSIILCRDASSSKETPRTSKRSTSSDKPVHFAKFGTPRQLPKLFFNSAITPFKLLDDNDSGFFNETPERSESPKSQSYGIPLLHRIENLHQRKEYPKEESLEYLKHSLSVSETKNFADLSTTEILRLYHIYRFQRMGLKPTAADMDVCEKHILINEMNEENENGGLSWKDRLEYISAGLEKQPKVDFLSQFHKMNVHSIVHDILLYLPGQSLQSASCVSQMWRKLVFNYEDANVTRLCYLRERQKFKKEREKKKLANPFQRPPNFRTLRNIENIEQKQLFQLKKTIKEINFDAFVEVGKSGNKYKPMKCPSCGCLSLQDKQVINKCICLFCGYEFCCSCLKPYSNWHLCASAYLPATKPPVNSKKYLRRL